MAHLIRMQIALADGFRTEALAESQQAQRILSNGSDTLYLKFAGGAALVVPALIFIFAVRKYLFAMWGIANR